MMVLVVLVSVLINCDKGEPSCKDAVEKPFKMLGLDGREATLAIGRCEQASWSAQAKTCVVNAKTRDELAACGKQFAIDVPANDFAATLAKMTEFKDAVCACVDSACAMHVTDEMTKWAEREARMHDPPRMIDDESKQAAAVGEVMGRCAQQAMSRGSSGSSKMPF